jgi:hypothetical protein
MYDNNHVRQWENSIEQMIAVPKTPHLIKFDVDMTFLRRKVTIGVKEI